MTDQAAGGFAAIALHNGPPAYFFSLPRSDSFARGSVETLFVQAGKNSSKTRRGKSE